MPIFQASEVATWCGGVWKSGPPAELSGVSTDTRTLRPGHLYVALRGARFDGHEFVPDAFARGAAAALVSNEYAASASTAPGPLLGVPDTLKALGRFATAYRTGLSVHMIAVTGSTGKTTVKEMIADILASAAPTARTRGNWNNEIGLPLSLLAMERTDRFGVFEVGMNHPGELAPLCVMLRPDAGVVTNVGPVHLEFFDSVEAIAREKSTVFRYLPTDGIAVLNRDERWYPVLRPVAPCRVVTVSMVGEADYVAELFGNGRFQVRERVSGDRVEFELPQPGSHMVANALQAIAVGRAYGVAWDAMRAALGTFAPPPMRWACEDVAGVSVVNDAYNANPVSMRAALKAFDETAVKGGRWLVLGGMLELGASTGDEHRALGRDIARGRWAGLVAVGPLGSQIADGAEAGGMSGSRVVRAGDHAAGAAALASRVAAGDAVLFKASRGERMEKVLELWKAGLKKDA